MRNPFSTLPEDLQQHIAKQVPVEFRMYTTSNFKVIVPINTLLPFEKESYFRTHQMACRWWNSPNYLDEPKSFELRLPNGNERRVEVCKFPYDSSQTVWSQDHVTNDMALNTWKLTPKITIQYICVAPRLNNAAVDADEFHSDGTVTMHSGLVQYVVRRVNVCVDTEAAPLSRVTRALNKIRSRIV